MSWVDRTLLFAGLQYNQCVLDEEGLGSSKRVCHPGKARWGPIGGPALSWNPQPSSLWKDVVLGPQGGDMGESDATQSWPGLCRQANAGPSGGNTES